MEASLHSPARPGRRAAQLEGSHGTATREADGQHLALGLSHRHQGRPEVLAAGAQQQVGVRQPLGEPDARAAAAIGHHYDQVSLFARLSGVALDRLIPDVQGARLIAGMGVRDTHHRDPGTAPVEEGQGGKPPGWGRLLSRRAEHWPREGAIQSFHLIRPEQTFVAANPRLGAQHAAGRQAGLPSAEMAQPAAIPALSVLQRQGARLSQRLAQGVEACRQGGLATLAGSSCLPGHQQRL